MKGFATAGLAGAVFMVGLWATFPTRPLVNALLTRLPSGVRGAIERIGGSRLSWRGLVLEDVTLRLRPDSTPLEVAALVLRPSLRGLLTARGGRPWQVDAAACGGAATAEIDRRADGDTVAIRFRALELEPCLVPLEPSGSVEGTATGEAQLVLTPGAASGQGTLTLTEARWQVRGIPRHLPLHADQATLRWRLADRALHVEEFTMTNAELAASGTGRVAFPTPDGAPGLDLRLRVQPSPTMPQAHRDLLTKLPGSPPDGSGARTYRLAGPLTGPVLGMP